MPAGLSGSGWFGMAFETTKGSFVAPNVYIPILSESFRYTEDRYFSPQIRQETIVSDVKQGYYHIEGEVELEVDVNYLPYLLYCTRHNIAKSGSGPFVYTFTPSDAGSSSTGSGPTTPKTASVVIERNEIQFAYTGCVIGGFTFFIDGGVLKLRIRLLGEEDVSTTGHTPTWQAPSLFGADAHEIAVGPAGLNPTFTPVNDFNGFEFEVNFNAEAQNRIVRDRSASYISFGETELRLTTELDFIDKTEYNNFVATTQKAIRLESLIGGANFTAATQAVRLTIFRGVYETYDLGLSGIGDLIMAGVTMRGIGIAGGSGYRIEVKSPVDIT